MIAPAHLNQNAVACQNGVQRSASFAKSALAAISEYGIRSSNGIA